MKIIQPTLGFLDSPNDPDIQRVWAQDLHNFEFYTVIFLGILTLAFIGITILIRRQKNQKIRKRLLLTRKAGTYLALIGWGLFISIQMGWIWILFGE